MPAKLPVRFFPSTSPVHDLFLGQLDQVEDIRQGSEISLVFFYAPWCGQSAAVREEIEQVAKSLADQVREGGLCQALEGLPLASAADPLRCSLQLVITLIAVHLLKGFLNQVFCGCLFYEFFPLVGVVCSHQLLVEPREMQKTEAFFLLSCDILVPSEVRASVKGILGL